MHTASLWTYIMSYRLKTALRFTGKALNMMRFEQKRFEFRQIVPFLI